MIYMLLLNCALKLVEEIILTSMFTFLSRGWYSDVLVTAAQFLDAIPILISLSKDRLPISTINMATSLVLTYTK